MSNEDFLHSQTVNSNLLAKQYDSVAADKKGENKLDIKEPKSVSENSERTERKRESLISKKHMDRLNKIHLRRSGGKSEKSPSKTSKQEQAQTHFSESQEEIVATSKTKNGKQNQEELDSTTKFKRKTKDVEKPPDSKMEKSKKQGNKTKAITAFGTTFHRTESDLPPLPKKRASSSSDRYNKSKRSKSKDAITEDAGDEPSSNSSRSQLRPSTRHSNVRLSLSKNKLSEMLEDKEFDNGKIKGAFESATGNRARSPYHTSSKVDTKKQSSKVRMEGDSRHTNGKQDEKSEIGKDLSFFEKIQQNVRAYFSPKSSEITRYEEEGKKKVQAGEHPGNGENIMIWKDGRIERGFEEDFMKGVQDFFMFIGKEKKNDLDKSCNAIASEYFPGQKSAKGNGSGPGGKIAYSNGDKYKPSTNYQCKRFYCIKRRNCTEKPRTGSFHRSKTFQKNSLAPSPPKSGSSVSLILEPDEQVENISSANGMASAFIQIQELHQEISPNVAQGRVNYARGTRNAFMQEDKVTHTMNYAHCEMPTERMSGSRTLGRRTCRTRLNRFRRKRTSAVVKPKSTPCTSLSKNDSITNKTKSEESIRYSSPFILSVLQKDLPCLTASNEKVKSPLKKDFSFVPVHRQWFVYSVTNTRSIQTNRQESASAELNARNTRESGITPETAPEKYPETGKKAQQESPSVTLKEIISLLRTIFNQSSEKVTENGSSGLMLGKDTDNSLAMKNCLEKLMEEKKKYLNMEKTKKLQKAHKDNFISDSFNFFNVLNKEFLSVKSSNPRIEELRDVITQKKEPKMEEYLNMYKRVIRMSLTEPEQCLMDEAKQELEHYTDMYYDLMKRICLEKEGKGGTTFPSEKSSEKRRGKIDYEEIFKSKVGKTPKSWDNCSEKAKPRLEKSHNLAKAQERRTNRDSDTRKSCCKTSNLQKNGGIVGLHAKDHNKNYSKTKPVVELLSPHKSKESNKHSEGRKNPERAREDHSPNGKILLALSLRDNGLLIEQAEDGSKGVSDGKTEDKTCPAPESDSHGSSEAFSRISLNQKSQPGHARADFPPPTVCPKSSVYEDDTTENRIEQSRLKFKAFREIIREGLQRITQFNQTETEDEQRQRCKRELESKTMHKSFKTRSNDRKRDLDNSKSSVRNRRGADSSTYSTREENKREHFHKKRSSSFSRSLSPNEKEDTLKKVPWWRKDNFAPANSGESKLRKTYQTRKKENYKSGKRTLPKTKKETSSEEDKKKRKIEVKEETEEDSLKSDSEFATPPETFFEWQFRLKDLEELLQDIASRAPNVDGSSEGKSICPDEEEEERELRKMNLSVRDENDDDVPEKDEPSAFAGDTSPTSLRLELQNSFKSEWMEESSPMNYQKITEVLNQLLGSVAEVWKVGASLKSLIQPEKLKAEEPQLLQTLEPKEDQALSNHRTIESFKNFLRILTAIFEDDPREEVVGKQLSLLKKEFTQHTQDLMSSAPQCEGNERTRYVQEIAEIPREVREMIANELTSAGGEENTEPAFFLAAVKKVGEKLKDSYSWDESESQTVEKSECCQPQKIYYHPSKEEGKEEPVKSNLGNLAEKIRKLCKEKNTQESVNEKCLHKSSGCMKTRSSVYFDAADTTAHSVDTRRSLDFSNEDNINRVTLSPIDESYFSLNTHNFEKYRNLIYDKIITSLRSDNPRNINYGIVLLGKMIDRDGSSLVKIEKKVSGETDEREKKWQDLLDNLIEMCQMIETEIKKDAEKWAGLEHEGSEKKIEIKRTCEYLKGYVERMKSLIKDMKSMDGQHLPDDPVQCVKALNNSRETNMKRQLASPDTKFPAGQKYLLDSAMDFINSMGNIGYSFDKFPFFSKCFGRNISEEKTCPEINTYRNEVSDKLVLEGNKTLVKSLRKSIEKRQRKIQGMIEMAGKGATRKESFLDEKITRKVRDLKKYYLLLEKMICDPTLPPPKWLKLEEKKGGKNEGLTDKKEVTAMTMLEDLMKQVSVEHKTLKYSKSTISTDPRNTGFQTPASVGSLTLVKIKYETLNLECPAQSKENTVTEDVVQEAGENGVPLRPVTA